MQPDHLAEARDWLARAERDVLLARRALEGDPPLADGTAFHTQQAVEKALKAILAGHGAPVPRAHELSALLARGIALDSSLRVFLGRVDPLTPYEVRFRYPGGPIEPAAEDAREALTLASEVVSFVRARLM